MRHRFGQLWCSVAIGAIFAVAACTENGAAPQLGAAGTAGDAATDAGNDAAATKNDAITAATDTGSPPVASCAGSALNEGFAAKDPDCKFLEKCPTLGQCYCGDQCPANKTPKCDASLCINNTAPKCFCGEGCSADKKKCPAFVCTPLDEKLCKELDDCVYVNTPPPSWCGCQKMPDHAPDCWCGSKNCTESHPECPASKCVGKSPDKCVLVVGAAYTSCWCDTCGLFGDKAKCFFVLCPH